MAGENKCEDSIQMHWPYRQLVQALRGTDESMHCELEEMCRFHPEISFPNPQSRILASEWQLPETHPGLPAAIDRPVIGTLGWWCPWSRQYQQKMQQCGAVPDLTHCGDPHHKNHVQHLLCRVSCHLIGITFSSVPCMRSSTM